MKKSLGLLSAFAVLLIVSAIAPVMAQPSETSVTATQVGGFKTGTLTYGLNSGEIFFYDGETVGTVSLYISSTTIPDYVFEVAGIINGTINTKTDDGVIHYTFVWTYKIGDEVKGTFEGQAKAKTTTIRYAANGNPMPQFSTNILHTVLQGTGVFEGQKLELDGIRPAADINSLPTVAANPLSWQGILMSK